jgi:hypothetical protein
MKDEDRPLIDLAQQNTQWSLQIKMKELELREQLQKHEIQMNETRLHMGYQLEVAQCRLKNAQFFADLLELSKFIDC